MSFYTKATCFLNAEGTSGCTTVASKRSDCRRGASVCGSIVRWPIRVVRVLPIQLPLGCERILRFSALEIPYKPLLRIGFLKTLVITKGQSCILHCLTPLACGLHPKKNKQTNKKSKRSILVPRRGKKKTKGNGNGKVYIFFLF